MMKKLMSLTIALTALSLSNAVGQRAFMEQSLISAMDEAGPNQSIPVFVMLEDAADMAALKQDFIQNNVPVSRRAQLVMGALKSKANATQPDLIAELDESGFAYTDLQRFWISNSIALRANVDVVEWLSNRPEIDRIILNSGKYAVIDPVKTGYAAPKSDGGIEPGLAAIGAPEMWALGYTGLGRIGMTFDTGLWPDHPALSERFLPNLMPLAATWYGIDSDLPADKPGSHGTHVGGTMIGLEAATADTIGVAPKAYLIANDLIEANSESSDPVTTLVLAYQWALNPDGDDNTSGDVPDVINNSWGIIVDFDDPNTDLCPDLAIPLLLAIEAAGVANVWSAGNDGPGDETIGLLQNLSLGLVNTFSVAAVNGNGAGPNWNIANFSSRGPSACGGEGSLLIKPEVSAPGVNVRSSVGNGGYDVKSGTSMSAPHVSGAVLLLKEAFPYLSGEDLLLALYFTAIDQGVPGEDNTYGMGMINVKDAYDYLAENNDPVPPASSAFDLQLTKILNPDFDIACDPELNNLVPLIEVRNNGTTTAEGISIVYTITGEAAQTYSDPLFVLEPGNTAEIELPFINSPEAGSKELHIQIVPADDEYDKLNNNRVHRWTQLQEVIVNSTPFVEDFENGIDPELWHIENDDANITWNIAGVVQANGIEGNAAWMDFASYQSAQNQMDILLSPWFRTDSWNPGEALPSLSFDLFYRKKTSFPSFQDTLAIFIAEPCEGGDILITEIFREGGEGLYTNDQIQVNAFPTGSEDWSSISIALNDAGISVEDLDDFYVQFVGINRNGNNLLIDNINISWSESVSTESAENIEVNMYPNPAQDAVFFNWSGNHDKAAFRLHDLQGRLVGSENVVLSGEPVQLPTLVSGLYLATLSFADGNERVVKLVIQ